MFQSSHFIGAIVLLGATASAASAAGYPAAPAGIEHQPITLAAEPAAGRFLVARRSLADPHFKQTVIYLLRHGNSGTAGLIINQPSGLNLSDAVADIDDADIGTRPIYFGGPLDFNTVSMLIRNDTESRLVERISGDIFLSGDRSVLERMVKEKKPDDALHFYLGHAGWLPGQLVREIRHEDWYVIDTDPVVIFSSAPKTLWKRLIEKLDPSGRYARNDSRSTRTVTQTPLTAFPATRSRHGA